MLVKIGRCLLTLVLAFAFAVSPYSLAFKNGSLRVSETENAHAVAFLAPAGIAAAGMGAEECLAAFAAIGAVTCGWSLKDYVGASVDDIASWTDEQVSKGLDALDEWTEIYLTDPEFWEEFDKMVQTEGGNGGNNGGGKDPKDFDSNAAWRALMLVNGASLAVSAAGFFADGFKQLMSANGSLEEAVSYPPVDFSFSGSDFSFPVSSGQSYSVPALFTTQNRLDYVYSLDGCFLSSNNAFFGDHLERAFSLDFSSNKFSNFAPISYVYGDIASFDISYQGLSDNGYPVFLASKPVSDSKSGFYYSRNNGNALVYLGQKFGYPVYSFSDSDSSSSDLNFVFRLTPESVLSPALAIRLNKAYENTVELDNKYEIADAPKAITSLDVDTIKDYLQQISANTSTGTYTYIKPTTTTVRNTYTENLQESTTKPDKVTDSGTVEPKPDEPDEPEGFDWNKFLQPDLYLVFPFCLPWDLYSALAMLNADPVTPNATLPLITPVGDFEVDLDLKDFDGVARVLRTVELLACAVGLIFLTKKMINL